MRLLRDKKIICLFSCVILILLLSSKIPTFARFKNRVSSSSNVWNGMVASRYKSGNGTANNPYIISNCEELAYFSSQLENNNYEDVYFKITNNLRINEGIFKYENDLVEYIVSGTTYYVNDNKYYDNSDFLGEPIGDINVFPSLDGFSGVLDGDYHTIYGYYGSNGLFSDLSGEITSLYIENAFVQGTGNLGILSNSIVSGSLTNVLVDGYIVGDEFNSQVNNISSLFGDYTQIGHDVIGGISPYSEDSTFANCVSKVSISGGFISGGLFGYMDDSSIVNAYNTGNIDSYSSNGIGVIKGTGVVDNVYSSSTINGALVGYIVDYDGTFENSFITTDNDLVSDIVNSSFTSNDNYYMFPNRDGGITSSLTAATDLQDKNFLSTYSEFVSFNDLDTNPLNTWVFEDDMYPVLFVDDITNSYSELHVNTYTWNSYSPNLDIKNVTGNITFMINDIDNIHVTSKYYYVSNSRTPLSKDDLANVVWTPYTDIVRIDQEGFYVVYVKVVDNNSNVSYINSDLLVLDNTGSTIEISALGNQWTGSNSGEIYVNHAFNFTISASDALSGISSIEYYLSNAVVNDMSLVTWTSYSDSVPVSSVGEYILYVKVVDGSGSITYASTPTIVYDGYVVSNLSPLGGSGNNITSNSSLSFDVSYSNNKTLNITHNLISSILLPMDTVITMIDRANNKVYSYTIDSNNSFGFNTNGYASYPLSSFKEVGKTVDTYYADGSVTNESFTFIVDFSNTTFSSSYNDISIYLNGISNGHVIRPTITESEFNVSNNSAMVLTHSISTDFDGSIVYNSDSETEINISSVVNYTNFFDTSYFGKKIGLAIKLIDGNGTTVSKNYLKNVIFEVDDNIYLPGDDNIVRVNLNGNSSVDNVLTIITHETTSVLADGTYYINISPYYSNDGIYYSSLLSGSIDIPVIVSRNSIDYNYSFDVMMNAEDRIINKGGVSSLSFDILNDGLVNPNIKVSMYQKDELTAYNQDYTLIDMADYTSDVMDEFIDNIYYVSRNPRSYSVSHEYLTFEYNLDTTDLDKTCYKFVFDLYDGTIKVGSISKYVIVR